MALRQAVRWLPSAHRVNGRRKGPTSWFMVISLMLSGWAPSGPSPRGDSTLGSAGVSGVT
jgi:hypothetical protein